MRYFLKYRAVLFSFAFGGLIAGITYKGYQYIWWRLRTAAEMERVYKWDAYIDPDDPTLSRRIGAALLPKAQATNLYKTLQVVQEIFDQNNITYWACGGTLLGAVRCGGILPTDDDIDICVLESERPNIDKLTHLFVRAGYRVTPSPGGVTIKSLQYPKDPSLTVDVFVMKAVNREGKKEIVLSSPKAEKIWPTFRFETKNVFPLKRIMFGPIKTYIPRNPYPHLDKYYKNWNSVAYIWNHGHPFPPFYATLTDHLRKPAPWDETAFQKAKE